VPAETVGTETPQTRSIAASQATPGRDVQTADAGPQAPVATKLVTSSGTIEALKTT
jgi:hypothetical protein